LCGLVDSEKSTSKATPFASLENPLLFIIESKVVGELWMRQAEKIWEHFIVLEEFKD
jgi:hypothetical protein